jgi:hypothetical protein
MILSGCANQAINNTLPTPSETSSKSNTRETTAETPGKDTSTLLHIVRYPPADVYDFGKMDKLPKYDPANAADPYQIDLRSYDLSGLDLLDRFNDLQYASFDSDTKWPSALPKDYDPQKIMDLGKNPGLNVRALHDKGITGKGVGIAIIDQALLVDHIEYKDNVKFYEEIHWPEKSPAQMHGPAVASIAVGMNVGVAPEADLYYIAEQHGERNKDGNFEPDFTYVAQSIDRILEVNKSLSDESKIRVISISVGWLKTTKGYEEVNKSIEEAKKQGVFVISSALFDTYGYYMQGLGRYIYSNPDDVKSYTPGLFWSNEYYKSTDYFAELEKSRNIKFNGILLVPMDSRTTASPTGKEDYAFYGPGGISWAIPYLAGVYTLCCQVKPSITPEIFWTKALETGDINTINKLLCVNYHPKCVGLPAFIDSIYITGF